MGVFDKLKNVFFEEEEVEVEEPIKKVKKPTIAKKIDLPEMPKINEEKTQREIEIEEEVVEKVEKKGVSERDLRKSEGFKFPMDFEDDDFKEDIVEKKEIPVSKNEYREPEKPKYSFEYKKEETAYNGVAPYENTEFKKEQKVFRPTPIISPIYGVLDKNYKKDDVVQKKEVKSPSSYSKKVDLDSVREKAYGDLATDISASLTEETTTYETDDISLYDLNDNASPVVSKVTVGDAEEYYNDLGLEYNIDYKDHAKEKATGRRTRNSDSVEDEEINNEIDNSDIEVENNLFDLIDSMYSDTDKE